MSTKETQILKLLSEHSKNIIIIALLFLIVFDLLLSHTKIKNCNYVIDSLLERNEVLNINIGEEKLSNIILTDNCNLVGNKLNNKYNIESNNDKKIVFISKNNEIIYNRALLEDVLRNIECNDIFYIANYNINDKNRLYHYCYVDSTELSKYNNTPYILIVENNIILYAFSLNNKYNLLMQKAKIENILISILK